MAVAIAPLRSPCQVNLEITGACNHKCRYCYNSWRDDPLSSTGKMSVQAFDAVLAELIRNQVLNVILTGGEPFLNYEVLLHGVRSLARAGIMSTCNTNLTLASKERLDALRAAGLPHILTSLASSDPAVNDRIFNSPGAFDATTRNIRLAVAAGLRVSVNCIITTCNKESVYATGRLAAALGASNFFVTRAGMSRRGNETRAADAILPPSDYLAVLDAAIRVRDETGIAIGSLYQYPVCMLKDVKRYRDFTGRGCPAGKKMACIGVNGDIHACNHETKAYGNALTTGLATAWAGMKAWRDGSMVPADCKACKWYAWCEGGCRMAADALDQPDPLCQGAAAVRAMPDPRPDYAGVLERLSPENTFRVRSGLRYREESGFWIVHVVGSRITRVGPATADFLMTRERSSSFFRISEFPDSREALAQLVAAGIAEIIP